MYNTFFEFQKGGKGFISEANSIHTNYKNNPHIQYWFLNGDLGFYDTFYSYKVMSASLSAHSRRLVSGPRSESE